MADVIDFELERQEIHGADDGFLHVRRLRLRNVRADGSRSSDYVCDFVSRPKGPDAVVVALYRRNASGVEVLIREGLRPPLAFGRPAEQLAIPDRRSYRRFGEVVAGIIEREDRGEAGVRERAAVEIAEEAGYRVDAADVRFLGAGTFPSPGSMPEKYWLVAAEIPLRAIQAVPPGDGSPMEEGASTRWLGLDQAIADCVAGEIEDAKSELALRRLRDELSG